MTTENAEYVRRAWPLAVAAGRRYRLNPLVIAAQGAVESEWGRAYSPLNRRNYFGITAPRAQSASNSPHWNGAATRSKASGLWFREYATAQESFYDFARLISTRYPAAAALSADADRYAAAIAESRYISETNGDNRPRYAANLRAAAAAIAATVGATPPATGGALGLLAGLATVVGGLYWQRRRLPLALRRWLPA